MTYISSAFRMVSAARIARSCRKRQPARGAGFGAIRRPGAYGAGIAAASRRVPTGPALGGTVEVGLHQEPGTAAVAEWLASRGAAEIPHPGGTLLAHLERVHALLGQWAARPALRRAGLCHAFYGTDGFAAALGDPSRRDELASMVGEEAECLVYVYASCDRRFSYPYLAESAGPFKDRFTGTVLRPPLALRRDFAELTVANELDIVAVNPDLRLQAGPVLLRLFVSWKNLLSPPAWQSVQTTLPAR